MKKIITRIIILMLIASIIMPEVSVVFAASIATLPEAEGGIITLNSDVTLSAKYIVESGNTLTIDLNGYILTGPGDDYTIDNYGSLIITDSKGTGKIVGTAESASCIHNLGTLEVNGIKAESNYITIENAINDDMQGDMVINNSNISSTYSNTSGGAIMNWTNAEINNSTITNNASNGVGIYTTSGYTAENNSTININNSTIIGGKYCIYAKRSQSAIQTTQIVNINGGELRGELNIYTTGTTRTFSGEIRADGDALTRDMVEISTIGTNLILIEDVVNKDIRYIPEGVTLTVAKNVTVTVNGTNAFGVGRGSNSTITSYGNLVVEGTVVGGVYNKETGSYYPTLKKAISANNKVTNTLVLNTDINENITSISYYSSIIDLNGYTLTGDIKCTTTKDNNQTLTIMDSSENKTGTITGTITNERDIIIESGTIEGDIVNNRALIVNGGFINGKITDNGTLAVAEDMMEIVVNEDGTKSIQYKAADYSEVDKALSEIPSDLSIYTDESVNNLEIVKNSIDRSKLVYEQDIVDGYVDTIKNAINELEKKEKVSINGIKYTSLEEATENTQAGDTMYILTNINTTKNNNVVLNLPDNVTIDLQGYTITLNNMGVIFTGNNLKIQNGTFKTSGSYALWLGDEVSSDGIIAENVQTIGGVNVYNATNVVLKNVTAVGHKYYAVWADSGVSLVVESGEYSTEGSNGLLGATPVDAIIDKPLSVRGGNFVTNDSVLAPAGNDMLEILGGTYNTDVTSYLREGYECIQKNGIYTVRKIQYNQGSSISPIEYEQDVEITPIDTQEEITEPKLGIEDVEKTEEILLDTVKSTEEVDIKNKNVKVSVDISDTDLDDETKVEMTNTLTNKVTNAVIYRYYDITINVTDTNTNKIIGKLTKLNNKISITAILPPELTEVQEGYERKFYIVKQHNDNIEIIDATQSSDKKTITFETDEFSTYAIAYADTLAENLQDTTPGEGEKQEEQNPTQGEDKKQEEQNPTLDEEKKTETQDQIQDTKEAEKNPQTSDNIIQYFILSIISIIGLIVTGYKINKIKQKI